jgi:hypothetical protein
VPNKIVSPTGDLLSNNPEIRISPVFRFTHIEPHYRATGRTLTTPFQKFIYGFFFPLGANQYGPVFTIPYRAFNAQPFGFLLRMIPEVDTLDLTLNPDFPADDHNF